MQHPRPIGPTAVNVDAPFSVEMAQGYVPARSPIRAAWMPSRVGWVSGQTTHVSAPFQPSMAQGVRPEQRTHDYLPLRTGRLAQTPDVLAFAIESLFFNRAERPRLLLGARIPLPVSQTTHVQTPFSPDMAAGWHSDRNREWLPLRTGLVVNPTLATHTAAPFSLEMSAGSVSGRSRDWLPVRTGRVAHTPDVLVFQFDSIYAMRPERPRLLYGARIPLPISQTTHTPAPVFSPLIAQGAWPEHSRDRSLYRVGSIASTPDVSTFTLESVFVTAPAHGRQLLGAKIPLPVSQPTHTAAPFSVEMAIGAKPDRYRERLPLRTGQWLWTDDIGAVYVAVVGDTFVTAVSFTQTVTARPFVDTVIADRTDGE